VKQGPLAGTVSSHELSLARYRPWDIEVDLNVERGRKVDRVLRGSAEDMM
jgi:hypothetical protein